jgi:hypothetical protein
MQKLTTQEFNERCFAAIDEEDIAVQAAALVELYWNAVDYPERQGLFQSTCDACQMSMRKIIILAIKSRLREGV